MSVLFKKERFGQIGDISTDHVCADNGIINAEDYKWMHKTVQSLRKWTKYGFILLLVLQAGFVATIVGLHWNYAKEETEHFNRNSTAVSSNCLPNLTWSSSLPEKQGKPEAVSFKASRTTHIALRGNTTLVFDNVLEDTHSAYSSGTGVFTAPRPGRYLFSSTILSQPRKYVPACARKNGQIIMVFHTGESRQWNSGSLTIVEYMDAGDQFEIKTVEGQWGYVWGHGWTTLNGFWLSN